QRWIGFSEDDASRVFESANISRNPACDLRNALRTTRSTCANLSLADAAHCPCLLVARKKATRGRVRTSKVRRLPEENAQYASLAHERAKAGGSLSMSKRQKGY